jgi:GAF domain-containing protein
VTTMLDDRQAALESENAELRRQLDACAAELKEAHEQQTATAEVLQVINSSPGDLAPVFDATLEKALRLCDDALGVLFVRDGELFRAVAMLGLPAPLEDFLRNPFKPDQMPLIAGVIQQGQVLHVHDAADTDGYQQRLASRVAGVELGGVRTVLYVPLTKDGRVLGVFVIFRQEVRPFSDKQIALVQNFAAQAVIAMENARLITETREALDQQTAAAEVLQVINSSPGDLAPVFGAMLEKALRLCDAVCGHLYTYDGERFSPAAVRGERGFAEWWEQHGAVRPRPGAGPLGRIAQGERVVVTDYLEDPAYSAIPQFKALVDAGGLRSAVAVALRKDDALLGSIHIYRREVRPFSDKQIALLQNFAAQAVIAMENARLLTETREALEQQTATAEVLQVINSSPGDLVPVFDAMLEKAMRLCEASFGGFVRYDGDLFRVAANRNMPQSAVAAVGEGLPAAPGGSLVQLVAGEPIVHIADIAATEGYRSGNRGYRALVEAGGAHTAIWVALRQNETLLGAFVIYRREVRPFTDKQIALLQNFAAQAVIAIENARLITETREALEQQTATAEVLQVINSSPGDLAPVFDAILEKAMRLCGVEYGDLELYDGTNFRAVATYGLSDAFAEQVRRGYPGADNPATRPLIAGERLTHIADLSAADFSKVFKEDPVADEAHQTLLCVPLRRDGRLLGMIASARKEVRPFSEKEIALLENFGTQAVIAMENARLLSEQREALEQQTATAEVLQIINSSPGDLAPVFDAMLEKAMRLCEAAFGILITYDGGQFHAAALRDVPPRFAEIVREPIRPDPGMAIERILRGENVVVFADVAAEQAYAPGTAAHRFVESSGARSHVTVALRKDGALRGAIVIYRTEVRPFSDKQIALLQNFAAQAVIAMENARLLGELRQRTGDLQESLDYQTATSDVLKVISRSVFDLDAVLQTVVTTAIRLCRADSATIYRNVDGEYRWAAGHMLVPEYEKLERAVRIRPGAGTVVGRAAMAGATVQIKDAWTDPLYEAKDDARVGGVHTMIGVPLLREGAPIGVIGLARNRVETFSEREIQLVATFADQAVIAIENARLISELRQRTGDLQESLDYQTAISDVLKVISRSTFDLDAVMKAVVASAIRLCRADHAGIYRNENGEYRWAGGYAPTSAYEEHERDLVILPGPGTVVGRAALEGCPVQITDAWTDPQYEAKDDAREGGVHTMLGVPLLREGSPIGVIGLARKRIELFTDKQIALVATFADQAVIAVENARLFDELRERTEELAARQAELRVTFDNMGDGVVMFDEDLRLAAWNRNFQELLDLPDAVLAARPSYGEYLRILAERGEFGGGDIESELGRRLADTDQELRLERTRPDGRIIEVRRNAVPGGGFVLIYSDITERKEAEARLRAARDTAEGALRELEAAQASLIHSQKMAALGQLTAGVAHEIKNPLNFVNNFAGLSVELLDELKEMAAPGLAALGDETRAEVDEIVATLSGNLEKIAEHGRRADGIVKSMLDHSRGGGGERRPVDINAVVDEALNLAYHGARAQDQDFEITLERDLERGIAPIELMPQDLTRVFLNLLGNGFYAVGKRRRETADAAFRPVLTVTTRDLGGEVEIRVRDNGAGIAPEIRDKLFQPFFTTKPTGEGTGLGLSICYDIVTQQHGGTITVDSRFGEYTEFTIRLPRRAPTGAGQPPSLPPADRPGPRLL